MATDDPDGVHEPEAAFAAPWTDDAPPPTRQVVLELDADAARLLDELMARGFRDVSDLIGWALGAYWRELEGIVLPPPPEEDIEAVLRESEEDFRAGRTATNQEVFARIDAKYGW